MISTIPSNVAHQICTGQVITSASAACKELLDNALDSGRPHSTSKMSNLSDLNRLSSLGFRGEALNALCNVGSVSIITSRKGSDDSFASKLQFDHEGKIVCKTSCSRQTGVTTTVTVSNLFETLPVRRRELLRIGRRGFNQLLTIVQAYAVANPSIRLVCNSYVSGKKYTAMVSRGGDRCSIREAIQSALFGGRSDVNSLLDIVNTLPSCEICALHGVEVDSEIFSQIELSGLISSCQHGKGRNTSDMHLIFVNRRPVDYKKICRTASGIYRQFNRSQNCMLCLSITLPPEMVDVNVSADKRSIFVENEKHLMAMVEASIVNALQGEAAKCPSVSIMMNNTTLDSFLVAREEDDSISEKTTQGSRKRKQKDEMDEEKKREDDDPLRCLDDASSLTLIRHSVDRKVPENEQENKFRYSTVLERSSRSTDLLSPGDLLEQDLDAILIDNDDVIIEETMEEDVVREWTNHIESLQSRDTGIWRTQQSLVFSMETLAERLRMIEQNRQEKQDETMCFIERTKSKFISPIDPAENQNAEEELDRFVHSEDFDQMEVIGQFNKGFIITRLRDDLFIVDQHASDEKFNFEQLQKNARLQTQTLIRPKPLILGAVQEAVLENSLDVFAQNGFHVRFDTDASPGHRAFLTAVPSLHNWQLDANDMDEMLGVLAQFPGSMYRPSKLRRLFASKACRKSIMIGQALTIRKMEQIISNLGTLDHPWNCPHGRPTLRHLSRLSDAPGVVAE